VAGPGTAAAAGNDIQWHSEDLEIGLEGLGKLTAFYGYRHLAAKPSTFLNVFKHTA